MRKNDGRHRGLSAGLVFFLLLITLGSAVRAEEITYDAGNRRDPFVPLTAEDVSHGVSAAGIKLEGIIYDPGSQSMAILNGKPYQTGDDVGGATVLKILKDHVVISVGGELKIFWIREQEKN